jgi:hypothetical protein
MQDYATWQAAYNDGTVINQKDKGASYEALDRSKLTSFSMLTLDGGLILHIPLKEGQAGRLIWRRRIQKVPGAGEVFFYIVGKRGAFVAAINPNYEILVDDTFSEDNALFGEVEPVKGEDNG